MFSLSRSFSSESSQNNPHNLPYQGGKFKHCTVPVTWRIIPPKQSLQEETLEIPPSRLQGEQTSSAISTNIVKQKESCKRRVMFGSAVGIASALILILNVTQPFTFIENIPSKANLAITITLGLIIALSIAFVAYYKYKENDCDTKLSKPTIEDFGRRRTSQSTQMRDV